MKPRYKLLLLLVVALLMLWLIQVATDRLLSMENLNCSELQKLMDRGNLRLANGEALNPVSFMGHLKLFLEHYAAMAKDEAFLKSAYPVSDSCDIPNILRKLLDHLRLFYVEKPVKLNGIIAKESYRLRNPSYVDENDDITHELSSFLILSFLRGEKTPRERRYLHGFDGFINGSWELKSINGNMRLAPAGALGLIEYFYICFMVDYEFVRPFVSRAAN
jgi:hypothetical protein